MDRVVLSRPGLSSATSGSERRCLLISRRAEGAAQRASAGLFRSRHHDEDRIHFLGEPPDVVPERVKALLRVVLSRGDRCRVIARLTQIFVQQAQLPRHRPERNQNGGAPEPPEDQSSHRLSGAVDVTDMEFDGLVTGPSFQPCRSSARLPSSSLAALRLHGGPRPLPSPCVPVRSEVGHPPSVQGQVAPTPSRIWRPRR